MSERIIRNSTEWFEALDAHIAERRDAPFEWGVNDCCCFAADWVKIATGVDPMAELRGLTSALAAHHALEGLGGMLAAVEQLCGPHIPGSFAQVGDVAMVTLPDGHKAMAICLGPWIAAPSQNGLSMLPIDLAEATWRV